MNQSLTLWAVFTSIILTLLILDLGLFHKKDTNISFKQSLALSTFYIIIACFFGIYIYYALGTTKATEYFAGFLLEKAMSLDNIFVISIIFSFFQIPAKYQHRVLFWGILGVITLRGLMISLGVSLLASFSWILFIFAALLIITGIKILTVSENHQINIEDMYIYKLLKNNFNIYPKIDSNKFLVFKDKKIFITPLLMALITVETMDIVFAIDSIPAIFAITQDTYVIYTSNIFAILGLRAMFFLLANAVERFKYIKYSLAIILILIGIKIFASHFINIPHYATIITTFGLLFSGVMASIFRTKKF
jgi:tellurite resistance protein TerC